MKFGCADKAICVVESAWLGRESYITELRFCKSDSFVHLRTRLLGAIEFPVFAFICANVCIG